MIQSDIVCDICGKKRGRPNNHDLCAIKRKAKHAADKTKPASRAKYTKKRVDSFMSVVEGTYHD